MFPINRIETGGFGITTGNLYNVKNINEIKLQETVRKDALKHKIVEQREESKKKKKKRREKRMEKRSSK